MEWSNIMWNQHVLHIYWNKWDCWMHNKRTEGYQNWPYIVEKGPTRTLRTVKYINSHWKVNG